jgi:hypothetical protein
MIFNFSNGPFSKTPVLDAAYPKDVSVNVGDSATFKAVIAEDGKPAEYTYQWYYDGSAVEGANGITYSRVAEVGEHSVYCMVTNKAGMVKSRTATVTAEYLYLYKAGDTCDAITGGWNGTKGSNYISFGGADNGAQANTKNKISFEGYTKLVFEYEITSNHGSGLGNVHFAVSDRTEVAYRKDYAIATVKTEIFEQGKICTVELDVSSVTQAAYVRCSGWYGSGKMYNAWLVP